MKRNSLIAVCVCIVLLATSTLGWTSKDIVITAAKETEDSKSASKLITASEIFDGYVTTLYNETNLASANLDLVVFKKAVTGYYNLKHNNRLSVDKQILSIVDFTRSSQTKRLWIIDLAAKKILFNSLVAHGQGSGDDLPTMFSNLENSHQSSLGFYVTSDIYFGKHGKSLKLNGMDDNFNTNALPRSVVVHGAPYVSETFIKQHGRLGRSHGCPAVPVELTEPIIETIKGNTCLFINGPEVLKYSSNYLNIDTAVGDFIKVSGSTDVAAL